MIIISRIGESKYNNQGCLMKIVEDNSGSDIVVEFQDEYKHRKHTQYCNFKSGSIKNPYYPSVYGIGITGNKYPRSINCKITREYDTWIHILQRSYDDKCKERQPSYNAVSCCEEWLNYEAFYEWLHNQSNFDKWYSGKRWAVDKDILSKGNKIYSPENCCLIPQNVNCLFLKREAQRGDYPIGVSCRSDGFIASCHNPFTNRREELGSYSTPTMAFQAYKAYKENLIKQVARLEYEVGNITEQCYQAMMNYIVEIDD